MNYFTPELVAMGHSTDDDILDEQDRLWGEAAARYSLYIKEVKGSFPRGVRRLFARYYLHDATVHRIAQSDRYFLIELQLDTPPRSFLTFRYRLLRPAEVNKEALPAACRSKGPAVDWLYAEVQRLGSEDVLASPAAATWVEGEWLTQAEDVDRDPAATWPFWAHRILLSNGWELTLFFHDIEVEEYQDVLVPTGNGSLTARVTTSPAV